MRCFPHVLCCCRARSEFYCSGDGLSFQPNCHRTQGQTVGERWLPFQPHKGRTCAQFFGTEVVSEKIRRASGHGPETAARFSAPILGPTSFNYVGMGSKSRSNIWAHHPCPFFFIFAKFCYGFRQAFEILSLTPPACRCAVLLGFFLVACGVQFCKAAGWFGTDFFLLSGTTVLYGVASDIGSTLSFG